MSADNYGFCPRCLKSSGRIDREPVSNTLREDWDIGMLEDGTFSVEYSCMCRVCGFSFDFKHSQVAQDATSRVGENDSVMPIATAPKGSMIGPIRELVSKIEQTTSLVAGDCELLTELLDKVQDDGDLVDCREDVT